MSAPLAARSSPFAFSQRTVLFATLAGIAIGVAYTLSPLSVWAAVAIALTGRWLVRDLEPVERRVILAIFIAALVLRVLLVAGLFLSVDHAATPFGSLFGDEEYFKRRSLWLRSIALGVNISEADRTYALDEYSETSYLYWLAFLQILVGDAPYGVHLISMAAYLSAAVWLYRLARSAYGQAPAALTFFGVLFLPTLFFWSVSALRESVHFLLTVAAIGGVTAAWTRRDWRSRLLGIGGAAAAAYVLKDLRTGSMGVVIAALMLGSLAALAVSTWRRLAAAAVICVIAATVALTQPGVQARILPRLQATAFSHQGHAFTPGVHYKVLDWRFYRDRNGTIMDDMTIEEAGRYVARALVAAMVVPMPWQADTLSLRAYLPEHVLWLLMCLLAPVGVVAGARRHPATTFIISAYVALMFTAIALVSGNVGTLARHRGLVLPFLICLASIAVCDLLVRSTARTRAERTHS